jgi:hypothetical protein
MASSPAVHFAGLPPLAHAAALSFINAIQMNGQYGATSSIPNPSSDRYKIRSRSRKGSQPQRQLSKMFSLAMSPI